jgi:3-phosphoshikimate 1-carboxyvinyltransferase
MKIVTEKSALRGEVLIPTSKSHTIRAVTLSTLAHGKSTIRHPLVSSDCLAAVGAGGLFGAKVSLGEVWEVEGVNGAPCIPENVVDVKNSGTTLYFFMGTAALAKGATVLTGDEQIVKRPAQPLITALSDLGAEVFSTRNNGLPPVVVKGPAKGGKTRFGGIVSQYVSSLLIHCPLMERDSELEVFDVREKPYVQMTLSWLDRHGIRYQASDDFSHFTIHGGQSYRGLDVTVPGDFSSGTFFLVAGSISEADITLLGLDMNDVQGDKQVVMYLQEMGARITQEKGRIRVRGGALKGREFDLGDTPDALPAMAVAGCFAEGKTILRNATNARMKETDRIAVMAKELATLGAKVEELPDGLVIHQSKLLGRAVRGYRDHRVVMALAVAGTAMPGRLEVDSAEAVQVTVPNFLELMKGLGAKIWEEE